MQTSLTKISDTKVKITVTADAADISPYKDKVLVRLGKEVKLAGFRPGKAPLHMVEKSVDQTVLQREFLDEAMTALYTQAVNAEKIRPVSKPEVSVKKFVPFTTLDFEVETEMVGNIKLADYKKIKLAKPKPEVTAKDVNDVLDTLKLRVADKQEVNRAVKKGAEATKEF
jgi:trigger factor